FVFDLTARHLFQLCRQTRSFTPAMRFNDADDDILAATAPSDTFTQHAEGLAYARGVAEKHLKAAALLFCFDLLQPIFWRFTCIHHAVQCSHELASRNLDCQVVSGFQCSRRNCTRVSTLAPRQP